VKRKGAADDQVGSPCNPKRIAQSFTYDRQKAGKSMSDKHSNNTSIAATQLSFTLLPLYQQVFVTDLVLGPAAAIALARHGGVDLVAYDWWRVQLTPQAKRALEAQARSQMIARAEEERETNAARRSETLDAFMNARRGLGRSR
jgi:hypothetical protein